VVEVPAHGGRREVEPDGEVRGGGGPVHEDGARDPLTGRLVARTGLGALAARAARPTEFHNTSVPLLPEVLQVRVTLPGFPDRHLPAS
jgi:hypothetical protein